MIALAVTLFAVAIFGTLAYRGLRAADYTIQLSALCTALVAGQILVALTTATFAALLFAFAVYLITASAVAFAKIPSVRNVVLLSGALALVQGVNPLGPVMAVVLVPVVISLQNTGVFRTRGKSLLILLLFIPASCAGFVAYLSQTTSLTPAAWVAASVAHLAVYDRGLLSADFQLQGLVRAIELAAVALPVWITAAIVRSRASIAIAAVCTAVILSATVAALFGLSRPVALIAPALAMPSALAVCEWPKAQRAERMAFAVPAFGTLLTWFCAQLVT